MSLQCYNLINGNVFIAVIEQFTNIFKIYSGDSYFQYIFGIILVNFHYIVSIFSAYFQYIFSIFSAYFQYIFSIFSVYFQRIFSIFSACFQLIFIILSIFSGYFQDIFSIFSAYFQHIFSIFSAYFQYIFSIFSAYFQYIFSIFLVYFSIFFTNILFRHQFVNLVLPEKNNTFELYIFYRGSSIIQSLLKYFLGRKEEIRVSQTKIIIFEIGSTDKQVKALKYIPNCIRFNRKKHYFTILH